MRVKHIHAKPNEYIAVHRHHPRYQTRRSGGRGKSAIQIPVLAILIGLILLMIYWKLVFTIALIAGGIYLIYIFQKPLINMFCNLWKKIKP